MYNFDLRPLFYLAMLGALVFIALAIAVVCGLSYILFLGVGALISHGI